MNTTSSSAILTLTGIIRLDQYDWFSTDTYLGVIQIDLATRALKRLSEGRYPWRHQSGNVIYAQAYGNLVHRIVLVISSGLPVQITPCSSEMPNEGASDTDFEFAKLSLDQSKVAVEAKACIDREFRYQPLVFDTEQNLLASFDSLIAPEWLPNGRLLLVGEGIYITDANLENLTCLDDDRLAGLVNDIEVGPSGTRLVSEFNQQIWHMNLDGSDLKELIYGNARLSHPTWSPDGSTIAYLAVPEQDYYYPGLFFTKIETGESYATDLSLPLAGTDASNTVNGPLSWR